MTTRLKRYTSPKKVCRAYWNEFDPIGVVASDVDDEYDSYVPQTVKLAMSGADEHKLFQHIKHCVHVNMGLCEVSESSMRQLVEKIAEFSSDQSMSR